MLGLILLLLITVVCVLYVPPVRKAAFEIGLKIARNKTGYDIDVGHIYLSPFHHSPLVFYRAYKGWEDLPLVVEIDSLFIGHRGQDTLIYTHSLRLNATARSSGRTSPFSEFTSIPIEVSQLMLDRTTFHSDSMIEAVGIDVIVSRLQTWSPAIVIKEGQYPLHDLLLADADIAIDLREVPVDSTALAADTTAVDTLAPPEEPMLMVFDVPNGELRNVHFRLTPLGLDVRTDHLATNVTADVSGDRYEARRIDIGGLVFGLNDLRIPADTIYGDACVDLDNELITSNGIHVRSDEMEARVDLSAMKMEMDTMLVIAQGDAEFKGSQARLKASYNINSEAYDAQVQILQANLQPFLGDSTAAYLAGEITAQGQGINPDSMQFARVNVRLDSAQYETYNLSHTTLSLNTADSTTVALDVPGLKVDIASALPLFPLIERIPPMIATISDTSVMNGITSLERLTELDTVRRQIPNLNIDIALHQGSPAQAIIEDAGLDINEVLLTLQSDTNRTNLALDASIPTIEHPEDSAAMRLPAAKAALRIAMTEGQTTASMTADTKMTDGVMSVHELSTEAAFRMDLTREGNTLHGDGLLTLDSLVHSGKEVGHREIDLRVAPSDTYDNALRAEVHSDSIPLDIVKEFVALEDIHLEGSVGVGAEADGLPREMDLSASVLPFGVRAEYLPYEAAVSLGETPIVMEHNHVDLNGLPIYGADSTFIAFRGGLDLDSMRMDLTFEADSFAPVKLRKDGPYPVHGDFAADIRGAVTGPMDGLAVDAETTILPTTDITYPIDKKNLAQVKPKGTVKVHYGTAENDSLALGGQIDVDDGMIRYSPRIYPIMPFRIDSGSHIAFNGPIGRTDLQVSASQKVKGDVRSEGEETRRVDFITGVRVNGELDSLNLKSLSFFLEAPQDEQITAELARQEEETREGLAATLLATGMYVGESNVAQHESGYALSSIINSRINAALANSKVGKVVDIDISSAQTEHAGGKTNDMNISISKSFFKDRFRVTIGSTLTDNPEINKASGLFSNLSAEYKLTKEGNVLLRAFAERDYNNVLEGELYKAGLGVRALKEWRRKELYRSDSIMRTYNLTADAGVAYRSNNSIGPDLTLKSSFRNLMGNGETFTIKGNGAYYWALRGRHPGDPKKTDTYKFGINTSLIFPYLHWTGDNKPEGDTRYMLGYQYENIAGGYGVHKVTGSFTYFIRSSKFITHAFTPFSLSVVMMKAESDSLLDKAAAYPQLIKVIAGNEFIPSIGYTFTYNDYRSKRAVNTMFEVGVKESGNIINALYCLAGHKWDEPDKKLGSITFNQFVKMSLELRNKFNFTEQVCIATRLFAGANIPLGNSVAAPLSEAFYAGGPNSFRAASPYAYGPGNFYSEKYNQNFFHSGDVKLEANFELRFPIVWKLYGAAFLDAGNVWNWYNGDNIFKAAGIPDYVEQLQLREELYDGILDNPYILKQIALGTGAGLRLDLEGLVIRLDIGVAIHAPFQTYKYDKKTWEPDKTQPINTYFNIPSALDAIRINFGIGYPF